MRLAMGARDREIAILKVQLQQAQSLINAATGGSGGSGAAGSLSAALLAGRPSIIGPEALSLVTRMEKSLETQKAQAEVSGGRTWNGGGCTGSRRGGGGVVAHGGCN